MSIDLVFRVGSLQIFDIIALKRKSVLMSADASLVSE